MGIDSPVSMDWSRRTSPPVMRTSAATTAPTESLMLSPGTSAAAGTLAQMLSRRATALSASRDLRAASVAPFPVADLRQVLAVLVDVLLVLDQLVPHHLLQVGALGAQLRQAIDHVLTRWKRSRSFCTRMSKGVVIVPSSL
jgi:Tfp pilus assembly protein FimV